jgi:hypothetical protein
VKNSLFLSHPIVVRSSRPQTEKLNISVLALSAEALSVRVVDVESLRTVAVLSVGSWAGAAVKWYDLVE